MLVMEVDNPRAKKQRLLRDVRLDARFYTQQELAEAAGFKDRAVVWKAETGRPIHRRSANKILEALQARGSDVKSIDDIDWVISPTSKPPKKK